MDMNLEFAPSVLICGAGGELIMTRGVVPNMSSNQSDILFWES